MKPIMALKTKSGYSIFSILIVTVFSIWGITDALKAEVTYAADGKAEVIKSSNETVGDLLADLDIEINKEDHLSHSFDESLEDGMKIEHITAKEVTVIIDGEKTTYQTTADNIESFFEEENLEFIDEDDVSHLPSSKIEDGLVINVTKAFQVSIDYAGEEQKVWTTGGTVEEILAENKLEPKKADKIVPSSQTKITEGSEIKVTEVETKHITEQETIDYKTEKKKDNNLEKGKEKLVKKGKNGSVEKTYKVVYENNKEVKRTETDKKVLVKPENEVISIGTKVNQSKNKSTKAPSGGQTKTMEATAYTAECYGCSGVTATGIDLNKNRHKKVIAVDPNVIPLGSRVWVSGYGEAIAGDTGGDIKGNRIDLHFPNKSAAFDYGRRSVTVKILN